MKAIRMGSRIVLLAAGLLTTGAVFGQPPLTTIDDMLYKADGSPFDGELAINWRSFEGPGVTNVPTNTLTTRVRNGRLHLRLIPTTTALTAAYYSVRYMTAGSEQFTELWSVPPSDTSLLVRDVRINWPPSTTAIVAPATDITISDVEGLTAALDNRAAKGLGYVPSRAAVIGPTGDLEAASGSLADCLRVDGTTGPCGVTSGFTDNETPSGVIDGANAAFALAGSPNPAASLLLHRNGLLQKQGGDYSIVGDTITFAAGSIPQSGDILLASYRTNSN